ncbi:MAG: 3-deoxy-D-manno-octulosonic acid transferase [Bacteroidia bacterium]
MLTCVYLLGFFSTKLRGYMYSRSAAKELETIFHRHTGKNYTYFFCSSIGEFEQLIPLLTLFEKQGKQSFILFHSLNGLEHAHKLGFHHSALTPFDYFFTWKHLFRISRPEACIISKHELWPGFILAAQLYCPLYVINVVPRSNHGFITRTYRAIVFRLCRRVFFAGEVPQDVSNGVSTGDTRIDRIRQRSEAEHLEIKLLRTVLRKPGKKILLIGNAYTDDTEILAQALEKNTGLAEHWTILLIPNRPDSKSVLSSILNARKVGHLVEIIPVMGHLFHYYACADLAWIGGGFKNGNHNSLEAAFFGIPLVSGPRLPLLPDARYLQEHKVLSVIRNAEDFITYCQKERPLKQANLPIFSSFPSRHIYASIFGSDTVPAA